MKTSLLYTLKENWISIFLIECNFPNKIHKQEKPLKQQSEIYKIQLLQKWKTRTTYNQLRKPKLMFHPLGCPSSLIPKFLE